MLRSPHNILSGLDLEIVFETLAHHKYPLEIYNLQHLLMKRILVTMF